MCKPEVQSRNYNLVKPETVQNIAVADAMFAVSHLCHFFFRVTKFSFNGIVDPVLSFYQICWIALFSFYVLQLFMASILLVAAKEVLVDFSSSICTCRWWGRTSVFLVLLNILDGILLSLVQLKITLNQPQIILLYISPTKELPIETIFCFGEILFRVYAIVWIRRFVEQFYLITVAT